MRMIAAAGLLSIPILLADSRPANAQWPCPFAGCGGHCLNMFGRIHQHGPLFNYGPYEGYYPFEPYGPWTSDLRYNPPVYEHQKHQFTHLHAIGNHLYAAVTLQNLWKRLQPLQDRCQGGGRGWGHGHKSGGCASGNCSAQTNSGPACTLCGTTAQASTTGVATVLLTGGSE